MKIIFTKLSVLFCSLLVCLSGNAQIPNWQWANGIGGLGDDVGMMVAADSLGNVYTTGFFTGTVDFDPGPAIFNLTAAGNSDIFILKLDNAGDFMWAKAIGGTATDEGKSIAFDNTGNIYITGSFNLTADFDPGAATLNLTAVGNNDIFLLKLNTAGNFIWAKAIGGLNSDIGYSIGVDDNENVYTT